jgi:Legionella pneumophila major outer membrane protein precursor
MKAPLALLALSMSTALVADNCCDPCCKPCCVPQPRAPICCECYTPAFYEMQCDLGLFGTVDFLYWYGRENGLSYAIVEKTVPLGSVDVAMTTATTPISYKYTNAKWKPGVRLGLGWNTDCDGWDAYLNWTYYKGKQTGSTKVAPFSGPIPAVGGQGVLLPWANNAIGYGGVGAFGINLYNSGSAQWQLTLNQIDLEMGRRYYLSKCFTMRPYAGLRGLWTRTHFNLKGAQTVTSGGTAPLPVGSYSLTAKDSFKNRNWSVGFLAGFQPVFYFTEEFSLYANADAALLWGRFRSKTQRNYLGLQGTATDLNFSSASNANFSGMQPMLDLGMGLRWEMYWCEKRYGLELDAGWEHHVLFNHNYRMKIMSGSALSTTVGAAPTGVVAYDQQEVASNLGLGGLILRARFSF